MPHIDSPHITKIHLLDVGKKEYGDAVVCEFSNKVVMIDGAHPGDERGTAGHPSIPKQLEQILGHAAPFEIDLLIVSHAHQDHIGCLPALVADGTISVRWALIADPWLGWGRSREDDDDSLISDSADIRKVVSALREEIYDFRGLADQSVDEFLSDAATLESRYLSMVADLASADTNIRYFGTDDLEDLLEEFKGIGLKLHGPPEDLILFCAERIRMATDSAAAIVKEQFSRDAEVTPADLYRLIVEPNAFDGPPMLDAGSRPGPAINLQSVISQFEVAGKKFLFAGDFQFADPEFGGEFVRKKVRSVRQSIAEEAPFSFVKISHHGSHNSFDEEVLEELGSTPYLGLCAGENSLKHPDSDVLALLKQNSERLTWVRTDRNGLATLLFEEGSEKADVDVATGDLDDSRVNARDTGSVRGTGSTPQKVPSVNTVRTPVPLAQQPSYTVHRGTEDRTLELKVRFPPGRSKLRFSGDFTIEFESDGNDRVISDDIAGLKIGGDRSIMNDLLFVTDRSALERNIGIGEAGRVIASIKAKGLRLVDSLPSGGIASESAAHVRTHIDEQVEGVVLIGGYDVVPSQALNCLGPELRPSGFYDPDSFVVWNDDLYSDLDGTGVPDLPVSRIPDGRSAELVFKALTAVPSETKDKRFGIRNVKREFAIDVFDGICGTEELFKSHPDLHDRQPPFNLAASQVYVMLHGAHWDGSRLWGEPQNVEALRLSNLPQDFEGVVFMGCCWGALIVDILAGDYIHGSPLSHKTCDTSFALAFLSKGALGFVGCTGAHYSPTKEPYDHFGAPMHRSFWDYHNSGLGPAQALHKAKIDYFARIPHGQTSLERRAVEYKTFWQFTCLGLGW